MNSLGIELAHHLRFNIIIEIIHDLDEAVNTKWAYPELAPSDRLITLLEALKQYYDDNV